MGIWPRGLSINHISKDTLETSDANEESEFSLAAGGRGLLSFTDIESWKVNEDK